MEISIRAKNASDAPEHPDVRDPRERAIAIARGFASTPGPFAVEIHFADTLISSEIQTLEDLAVDLLVNRALISSDHAFSFFLSEEPLFKAKNNGEWLLVTYYKKEGILGRVKEIQLQEPLEDAISYLEAFCDGLISGMAPENSLFREHILCSVERDLNSENRRAFVDK